MPHISIEHLPVEPDERRQSASVSEVTEAVDSAPGVEESVISIALESAAPEVWREHVYVPEVASRRELLRKVPRY
jgi:phenylpyruvate tautomerase PptA (4-oxalocrotonate tautomerase family)